MSIVIMVSVLVPTPYYYPLSTCFQAAFEQGVVLHHACNTITSKA